MKSAEWAKTLQHLKKRFVESNFGDYTKNINYIERTYIEVGTRVKTIKKF